MCHLSDCSYEKWLSAVRNKIKTSLCGEWQSLYYCWIDEWHCLLLQSQTLLLLFSQSYSQFSLYEQYCLR